jgi:hypothetical protein
MSRIWSLYSSFNRGELDPRLVGRKDLQAYYAGAQTAQNVVTLVQGGMRRRNGTQYLHEGTEGRLLNFSFSTEVNYCLLFTDGQIEIFKDGVLQTNINGSGDDFLTSPYSLAKLTEMDYIQSADTAIIVEADTPPKALTRTSDTAWTLTDIAFSTIPVYDFNDTLSPTPTSEAQNITFANQTEGDRYKISLEGILTEEIVFAGDQATNITNITNALLDLPTTGTIGSITTTSSAITAYLITFSDDSAKDWDLMSFSPVSTVQATFTVFVAEAQKGVARSEPVWSVTRGYPRTTTFHEGRLYFGGSPYRPQTLWGSQVNQFFNFAPGRARDDEGIDVTIDTDQVNAITSLFSNRNLQVFTTGGEFYIAASPITPANIAIAPQTGYGSKRVRPVTIDGATLFVQRTGKAVRSYFFVDDAKAYTAPSISVLASHLINDPVEMVVSKGTESVDADYAYIINADGSMAVFNSLASEDVQGFTDWVTEGLMISAAVVDDTLYTYVKRTIGGGDVFYLEKESVDLTTDSSAIATNTDKLSGLIHLEGETIDVIADGAYQGEFVVSGGEVTIGRQAALITGGLNYIPIIETMPLNTNLQNGPNAALPKRIVRAGLQLHESNGVLVNGQRIADKTMGVDVFEPPIPNTGLKEMYLQGWSIDATLTVTQDEPMPLTLLACYLEVSI